MYTCLYFPQGPPRDFLGCTKRRTGSLTLAGGVTPHLKACSPMPWTRRDCGHLNNQILRWHSNSEMSHVYSEKKQSSSICCFFPSPIHLYRYVCYIQRARPSLCPLHLSAYLSYLTPSNRMGSCRAHSADLNESPHLTLFLPSDQAIDLRNAS